MNYHGYLHSCTYVFIYLIIYLHHLYLPISYPSINVSYYHFASIVLQDTERNSVSTELQFFTFFTSVATVFHLYTRYQMWTSRDQGLCFPDTKHIPRPSKWQKQVSFWTRNSWMNKSWSISVNTSRDFHICFILIVPKMQVRR